MPGFCSPRWRVWIRGEELDGVVGRWLREVDRIRRGRVCIAVAQVIILIANVVGWRASNHTSL